MNGKQIRLVVLDNPLSSWDSSLTQDLFRKLVYLKRQVYAHDVHKNAMPVNTTDFVGTHLLVCEQHATGVLFPLAAVRAVTLDTCVKRRAPFAWIGEGLKAIEKVVTNAKKKKKSIAYIDGWVFQPKLFENEEALKEVKDFLAAALVFYCRDFKVSQCITPSVKRFKMDSYLKNMGFCQATPQFKAFQLNDQPVKMFHLDEFSQGAITVAKVCEPLWDDKVDVLPNAIPSLKMVA